jgi:oligopeptide transport system substrate-binding protein
MMNASGRTTPTRRTLIAGGIVLAGGGLIWSLHGSRSRLFTPSAADSLTLHRGNGAEPDTLDPHKATGTWENNIVGDMFLGLMTEDARANPIPGAAESWQASRDGLTYTFTIRDHSWSDGTPVTAHDFVYAFRRVADPKTASQYVALLYPIAGMRDAAEGKAPLADIGVVARDDRTLEIRFLYQVPYLPGLFCHFAAFPVPSHVVEKYGDAWILPEHAVTNGPYVLKEWRSNDFIRLEKNPLFHAAGEVPIRRIFFYPTQDAAAAVKRFRGGEFDLITDTLPPQQVVWLHQNMRRQMRVAPYMLSQYVQFNLTQKPFDDIRLRRAMSLAIDREILCAKVMRGGEAPSYSLVPPGMPDYPAAARIKEHAMTMAARKALAMRLLAEAGHGPHNPLSFDFNTMNTTDAKIVAVALQEMWRQVGVEVRIITSESQIQYDILRKQNFAAGWAGWVADYRDAKDYLFLFHSATADLNYGRYASAEYDALLDQSDRIKDPAARGEMLAKAEQQMLDDAPIAPVYFGVTRTLVSLQVQGWIDNQIDIHRSRWLSLERMIENV